MKVTASVNRFNIRTCSDSFAALSQIIIQLANNSKAEVMQLFVVNYLLTLSVDNYQKTHYLHDISCHASIQDGDYFREK